MNSLCSILSALSHLATYRTPRGRLFRRRSGAELFVILGFDAGRVPNVLAPAIATHTWELPDGATLRDVVLVLRADEAHHRDVNHRYASELAGKTPGPI